LKTNFQTNQTYLTMNSHFRFPATFLAIILGAFACTSCNDDDGGNSPGTNPPIGSEAVFLLIDEESIDNGNEPNNFSDVEVNDHIARIGLRSTLPYCEGNIGKEIELYTGQVGDEGWFAPKTIPNAWAQAGPSQNGAKNYLAPGPGLGAPEPDDDREVLLDEIPDVTPLRATGLAMLVGQTVFAVVYDSDISINYSPLEGNLQGANLGVVAFEVLAVTERTDGSTSDLPRVTIRILDVAGAGNLPLSLFSNAPAPESSSEPFDITPPNNPGNISLVAAP
jgi:hypothetical protein